LAEQEMNSNLPTRKNKLDFAPGAGKVRTFDMRNSPLTWAMFGVAALFAVASAVMLYLYSRNTREFRSLQGTIVQINKNRALVAALATEARDYGTRNPAINPILKPFLTEGASTNKPPAK
jgi:hypothetical protein